MSKSTTNRDKSSKLGNVSAIRLRLGFILLLIWSLPMEFFAPVIAEIARIPLGKKIELTFVLVVVIIIIQSIIGLVGLFLVGQATAAIIKKTPRRKIIPALWHTLISGEYKIDSPDGKANKS